MGIKAGPSRHINVHPPSTMATGEQPGRPYWPEKCTRVGRTGMPRGRGRVLRGGRVATDFGDDHRGLRPEHRGLYVGHLPWVWGRSVRPPWLGMTYIRSEQSAASHVCNIHDPTSRRSFNGRVLRVRTADRPETGIQPTNSHVPRSHGHARARLGVPVRVVWTPFKSGGVPAECEPVHVRVQSEPQ